MEHIQAKSILQTVHKNNDKWFGIDYNINLYRGCSFGCIYCDSRSSIYGNENFDKITGKEHALRILEKELMSRQKRGVVSLGAMSDSYNPFEKRYEYTRSALVLIEKYGFGLSLETKSNLVLRDIDLFLAIAKRGNVIVKVSITTSDDQLSKIIEPRASLSSERFDAVRRLSEAGVFCGVLMTPLLPFITDDLENIEEIVRKSAAAGAKFIFSMFGVTLRDNQRDYFFDRLDDSFPNVSEAYQYTYKNSYVCNITDYYKKFKVFEKACEKYGLLYKMEDIIRAYKVKKEEHTQLRLF